VQDRPAVVAELDDVAVVIERAPEPVG